jgi:hypothetical protein
MLAVFSFNDCVMTEEMIVRVYDAFNKRDVDEVLAHFDPDVEWPNGWEGGYVHGQGAVRDYWYRQWKEIDPQVTPVHFVWDQDILEVEVIQIVKDLQGQVISNQLIKHRYSFKEDLIRKMEIQSL